MQHDNDDAWLAGLRGALWSSDLVKPPDWVRERAHRLFRTRFADSSRTAGSVLARVRAALIFDSRRPGLAPAGVRSSGILEGPWQLLYRGGNVDVDLLVRPNQDGRTMNVLGQALTLAGGSIATGVVEALPADLPRVLHGPTLPTIQTRLEPSGEFALSNLERGRYDMLLRFDAYEIELSDVEL